MARPSVREATPQKNPQSPREKGAECEICLSCLIALADIQVVGLISQVMR